MRGRPRVAVGAGVVGLAVLAVTAGCGGDDGDGGRGEDLAVLTAPDGWAASPSGLEIAEEEADLGEADPDGAVIRAEVGGTDPTTFTAMATEALTTQEAVEFGEVDGVNVDGHEAEAIAIRADGRVQQFVVVHPPGADVVVFVLDAPEGRYEALRETFQDAVGVNP